MKVKRNTLLLLACIVWSVAGFNVLCIGVQTYRSYVGLLNLLLSLAVFVVFEHFVFGRLVRRHTERIMGYADEPQFFLKFFDVKSFIIMAVMMSGGIWLRASEAVSRRFIAVFYTGLGSALLLAGVLFGIGFITSYHAQQVNKK